MNTQIAILHDGDVFFERILAYFAAAKSSIAIELYWFESGTIAERLMVALSAAVQRGVVVYCLLDDIGSRGLTASDRYRLRNDGINLHFYNRVRARALFQNLRRDHRKVFIIDGQVAFVGGPGIADAFLCQSPAVAWRDVLFELHGPILNDFVNYFAQFWRLCTGEVCVLGACEVEAHFGGLLQAHESRVARSARLVLGFGERRQHIKSHGLKAIRRAEREVWFFTGYFYPSWKLRRALRQAAGRGVLVKLLLPGPHSDHSWFAEAGRYYYRYLLAHGVHIFEYQPSFQHAKLLVCDDWVSFGSSNQDRWNQRWNLEANVEVQDPEFVTWLKTSFRSDFEKSKPVKLEHWLARPWWQRWKTYLLYRGSLAVELWLARRKWRRSE
jgi:phosphatidylserine/phosphatidylglycerophosphate/cardiolipin synthase-like enzyme